jgi:toxin ParE2
MKPSFVEAAERELAEATARYDRKRAGLGDEFAEAVEEAVRRILDFPEAWGKLSRGARCCPLKRFPYGIVYQVHGQEIRVVAVMHPHRKPGYWEERF